MTAPQIVVLVCCLGGTVVGTAALYPGVRKHTSRRDHALLAALMTAALASTAGGLFLGALYNGFACIVGLSSCTAP